MDEEWTRADVEGLLSFVTAVSGFALAAYKWGGRIARITWGVVKTWAALAQTLSRVDENVAFLRDHAAVADGRHAFLVNELRLPVWESDVNGACLAASDALGDLMGCPVSAILGHGWVNAIPEAERSRVREDWEFAVANQQSFSARYHYIHQDGRLVPVFAQATPVRDASGAIVRFIGRAREIEEGS